MRPRRYSKDSGFAIVRAMFSDKDSAKLRNTTPDTASQGGHARPPALELAHLRQEAHALESVGHYGRALAKVESAIRLADRLASDDPALSDLCSELRINAAQIARSGGRLQEALEFSECGILKMESAHGKAWVPSVEARLFRASTLLDLKRVEQARDAYIEIQRTLKSSSDHIGYQLEALLCSAAAVCASKQDFDEGTRELRKTAKRFGALLEGAVRSDFPEIASAFERASKQFERLGDFMSASVFMQHSLDYRKMFSRGKFSPELRSARQSLAALQLKEGRIDAGLRVSEELLGDLSDKFGAGAPEVMALRRTFSVACLEAGKWDRARALLEENVALAEQGVLDERSAARSSAGSPVGTGTEKHEAPSCEASLVESLLTLRDFLHSIGHTDAAGQVALNLSEARERNPKLAQSSVTSPGPVMQLLAEQFASYGGADPVMTTLATIIDHGLRLARQRLVAGGLGEAVVSGLGSLEEQSFLLPDRIASKVGEWIEEIRIRAAETPDQLAVAIEAAKRRIQRFEIEEGQSKELTRSKLYQDLGIVSRRAGQNEAAAVYFRQARRLLASIGLKDTRQYAETLLLSARVTEPELAGKMRRAARKILDRYREL